MTARAVPPDYMGFPRVRVEHRADSSGTDHFCRVHCEDCNVPQERSTAGIRNTLKAGGSFLCSQCNVRRTLKKRRANIKARTG